MDKIRTAVIGAGKMGSIHAKVYHKMPQAQLVAVVDSDIQKAKKLAKKFKSQAFHDCSEIVDKVDAVTIAAPTTYHLELAAVFIKKNIPVMIEKPLAANVDECRKIVDLARKNNTVVAVGHSERCNPVVQAMKRSWM
ncbi:MAG: Gfo/Idh/MocA family protein [Planctomycetota bacterium]|jgi:predicted dehydrogenase